MKNFSTVITFIKMIAKYGAYVIVLVDGLNMIADGWEKVDKEKELKDGNSDK